ncbi:hypothetical protein CR513_20366, partial [Mucuna pruriens]
MTRKSSFGSLHPFNPKIEKTLNRISKSKNMHVGHSSDSFSSIPETNNFEIKPNFSYNPLYEPEPMENNNRTLKELATLNMSYQPWCIQYLQLKLAQPYELKFGLIHLLPKFHSLTGVPRGLLNDETTGDPGRLHKDESIFILPRWSSERLALFVAGYVQHVGRHESAIPRNVLPGVQDNCHPEGDLWNPATLRGNTT